MTTEGAINIGRDWVLKEAIKTPGIQGAYIHGSAACRPKNTIFTPVTDIDIVIVTNGETNNHIGKILYRNVILDLTPIPFNQLQIDDKVLADYHLAANLFNADIILDNTGKLAQLKEYIRHHYPMRYWVQKRCENAYYKALSYLQQPLNRISVSDEVTAWLFGRGVIAHILLVADLQNPTVRKRYAEAKKVLAKYNLSSYYEKLLALSSFDSLTKKQTLSFFQIMTEIYDSTADIVKSPYRFAADISPATRSITIDGTAEMIEAGLHREAMFWIVATLCRCGFIISRDGSTKMQQEFHDSFDQLLNALHIQKSEERLKGNNSAISFLKTVMEIAVLIINSNSNISD